MLVPFGGLPVQGSWDTFGGGHVGGTGQGDAGLELGQLCDGRHDVPVLAVVVVV